MTSAVPNAIRTQHGEAVAGKPRSKSALARRTVSNALWNIVPLIWSSLLGLISIPIIVKGLGMSHFGLFGLFAVMLAPLGLTNLGFGEATIKYVAQYAALGDVEQCARFVRTTFFFNLCCGCICGLLLITLGPTVAAHCFRIPPGDIPMFAECLALVGLTWAVNQAATTFVGIPPAMHRFRTVALCQLAITTVTTLAGVAAVVSGYGLKGYTLANMLSSLLALLVWYAAARRLLPGQRLFPSLDKQIWQRAFKFGIWRAAAQMGAILANQSERFLLGVFLTPQAVGFYNVALNLEQRAYTIVFKMSEVLFPMFSAEGDTPRSQKFSLLMRSTWLLTSVAVCGLAPMVSLAKPLLEAWISPDTAAQASILLRVLSLAGMLGCASNASLFFLLGEGRTKLSALLCFATGGTTVIGAVCILPIFGLRGAAFSALLAMLAQQILLSGYILPRIFGSDFKRIRCGAALYAPVLVGLVFALVVTHFGLGTGFKLPSILAVYAFLAISCGGLIMGLQALLPGGGQHVTDAAKVLTLALERLKRKRQILCVGSQES